MIEKAISFVIPCYNSAEYMDNCIKHLLELNSEYDDIEIIIVNDGSNKDFTYEIAKGWEFKYPNVIKAIHQENGGHGQAVNTGLANATGLYFKVVDSDDWLDVKGTKPIMAYIREQLSLSFNDKDTTDLIIGNYVYNKIHEGIQTPINYSNAFKPQTLLNWSQIGKFKLSQYLLMHSIIYKTEILRSINFELPKHTFYVDNIYAYVPLPYVKSIYYIDTNMYMYFIGREDQSVNEKVMMGRIDQQIKITKIMIDNTNLDELDKQPKLQKYMIGYLSMMMCICSVFLRKIGDKQSLQKLDDIWKYAKDHDPRLKKMLLSSPLCWGTNIPTALGKAVAITGYKIAQNLFGFN